MPGAALVTSSPCCMVAGPSLCRRASREQKTPLSSLQSSRGTGISVECYVGDQHPVLHGEDAVVVTFVWRHRHDRLARYQAPQSKPRLSSQPGMRHVPRCRGAAVLLPRSKAARRDA